MSSSEIHRAAPERPWLRRIGRALVVAWAVAVLAVFFGWRGGLARPLEGLAATLAVGLVCALATWLTGWRIWRRLSPPRPDPATDDLERTACELGCGFGALAGLMFVLGALGLYGAATAWTLLAGLFLCDPRPFAREAAARLARARIERRPDVLACAAVCSLVGLMTLLESLAPESSQDALVYHLAIPELYVRAGGLRHVPGNFFASFPQNVEMLFTLGLLLHGESLAKLWHWLLGAACVIAVAALARRAGAGRGAWAAAAAFASVPTVALIAGWAYVDLGVALFQLLAVLAFLRWWDGEPRMLLAAALFTGLAGGVKYTGGAIGVVLGALIFLEGALRKRRLASSLAIFAAFGGVALAVAAPWFARNLATTGNPLFPFLNGIFGGRDWDPVRAGVLGRFLGGWGGDRDALDVLLLPFHVTFSGDFFSMENFDGVIGPVFLMGAPLAVLAVRRRPAARLVAGAIAGLCLVWLALTHQVRFLIPALGALAALIGGGLDLVDGKTPRAILRAAVICACAFNTAVISTHFAAHNPVPVVLGLESADDYLAREIPGGDYEVFAHIRDRTDPSARILFAASGNPGFLCKRDYRIDAIFENRSLLEILDSCSSAEEVRAELRRRGFTHLLFKWRLVFDAQERVSDIPLDKQHLLAELLNRFAGLSIAAGGTFLYEIGGGAVEPGEAAAAEGAARPEEGGEP